MSETIGQSNQRLGVRDPLLRWKRPRLSRLSTQGADHGTAGGGDTPGKDKKS
jgi:hypothetical protein